MHMGQPAAVDSPAALSWSDCVMISKQMTLYKADCKRLPMDELCASKALAQCALVCVGSAASMMLSPVAVRRACVCSRRPCLTGWRQLSRHMWRCPGLVVLGMTAVVPRQDILNACTTHTYMT